MRDLGRTSWGWGLDTYWVVELSTAPIPFDGKTPCEIGYTRQITGEGFEWDLFTVQDIKIGSYPDIYLIPTS